MNNALNHQFSVYDPDLLRFLRTLRIPALALRGLLFGFCFVSVSPGFAFCFYGEISPSLKQDLMQMLCYLKSSTRKSWMSPNTHNNRLPLQETQRVMTAKLTNLTSDTAVIRILVAGNFAAFRSELLLLLW